MKESSEAIVQVITKCFSDVMFSTKRKRFRRQCFSLLQVCYTGFLFPKYIFCL